MLGDQLDIDSLCLFGKGSDFDPQQDAVLMIEAAGEASKVWSHKARIAVFLSGMRHFRDSLIARGVQVHYVGLEDSAEPTLVGRLTKTLQAL